MDDAQVKQQLGKDILSGGEQMLLLQRVSEAKGKTGRTVWLALALARKEKVKIFRIKGPSGETGEQQQQQLRLADSWRLEDLKKIDGMNQGETTFQLQLEKKTHTWMADSLHKKNLFLLSLIDLCRTHLKKLPHLKNVQEAALKGPLPSPPLPSPPLPSSTHPAVFRGTKKELYLLGCR